MLQADVIADIINILATCTCIRWLVYECCLPRFNGFRKRHWQMSNVSLSQTLIVWHADNDNGNNNDNNNSNLITVLIIPIIMMMMMMMMCRRRRGRRRRRRRRRRVQGNGGIHKPSKRHTGILQRYMFDLGPQGKILLIHVKTTVH